MIRASSVVRATYASIGLASAAMLGCDTRRAIGPGLPVASIAIVPTAPRIEVGDTLRLAAVVRDRDGRELLGRTVAWSSQPNVVLSITSSGLVWAAQAGQATVIATSEGQQGTAIVTVTGSGDPVASITLDRSSATLAEGEQTRLAATLRDEQGREISGRTVNWTSSDPTVVSVADDGVVTAIRSQAAIITASADGKSATATVTVTADYSFDLVYSGWTALVGTPRLLRLRVGGENPEPILPSTVLSGWALVSPAASPDGARVAFSAQLGSEAYIYVANVDGSGLRQLTTGGDEGAPTWSPSGDELAYVSAPAGPDSDIWVMNSDGSAQRNLTGHLGFEYEYAPEWSPLIRGGERIAFSRGDFFTQSRIATIRPDGSDLSDVTPVGPHFDTAPTWAPDGSRLVFTREDALTDGIDLWVADATGANAGPLVQLPGTQLHPSWSPDGRLISFSSLHAPGPFQVYTVWADGTKLARRTDAPGSGEHPHWLMR